MSIRYETKIKFSEEDINKLYDNVDKMLHENISVIYSELSDKIYKLTKDSDVIIDYSISIGESIPTYHYITFMIAFPMHSRYQKSLLELLSIHKYTFANSILSAEPTKLDSMRETGYIVYTVNFMIHIDEYINKIWEDEIK
jgi:hypothetical protein